MSTSSDNKLDNIFAALRDDAPEPRPGELANLVFREAASLGPVGSDVTTHQPRKGRRIMISSILITIAAVSAYLIGGSNATDSTLPHAAVTVSHHAAGGQSAASETSTLQQRPSKPSAPNLTGISGVLRPLDGGKKQHYLTANISPSAAITLNGDELRRLGMALEPDSTLSLLAEDETMKTYFTPSWVRGLKKKTADEVRIGKSVPWELFPRFITDVHGNLFMIAEHVQTGPDSYTSNFEFPRDAAAKPNPNYHRSDWMRIWGTRPDSSTNPVSLVAHAKIGAGIKFIDTIIRYTAGDEEAKYAIIRRIGNRMAALDSTFKMSLGGEEALRAHFSLDRRTAKTSTELALFSRLDSIAALGLDELQTLHLQYDVVSLVAYGSDYPDTVKLRAEQFLSVIGCKMSALDHAKTQKAIADINSCIPILVRHATAVADDGTDNGLIVWFKPTANLFDAVPRLRSVTTSADVPGQATMGLDISAYPNPASVYLFGDLTLPQGESATIELRDLLGHSVLPPVKLGTGSNDKQSIQFDVSRLPAGIYVLVATSSGGGQSVRRVIVQRP